MVTVKKFSAEWCGPCRMLAPVFEQIKPNYSNVTFEEYDVDNFSEEVSKYSVTSVPTVIVVKDGVEVERFVGLNSKMMYENAIKSHI